MTGNGRTSSPIATLDSATVAPMPRASVPMPSAVKAGRRRELSQGHPDIAHQVDDAANPPAVAGPLLFAVQHAEAPARLGGRGRGRPALVHELARFHLEMEAHLFAEFAVHPVTGHERAQPEGEIREERHAGTPQMNGRLRRSPR